MKNVNYEIPITAADTPAQATQTLCPGMEKYGLPEVAAQWDKLVGAFARPRTALLFHLTNHYALIAAVRSYAGEDGEPVREVFTARKGQTPRVWLNFDEVRKICIGWTGYRIMQVYSQVGPQN